VLLTVGCHLFCPGDVAGAEATQASGQIASTALTPAEEGPERLKKEARITVETNALPVSGSAPKEKSSQWKVTWQGWNGLHYELRTTTLLHDLFGVGRENGQGTNAYQVFNLEQLKMSGKIGGKLAVDAAGYITGKEFQDFNEGVEVRRARLYAQGDCLLLLPVSYQLEIGYIPNELYIEESYLKFKPIPYIGELRIGQYQAPMGLEVVSSTRDISFMEPSAPMQALAPGVNAGIQIGRPVFNERATWALGLFTDGVGKDYGDASQDYLGLAFTFNKRLSNRWMARGNFSWNDWKWNVPAAEAANSPQTPVGGGNGPPWQRACDGT